MTRSTTRQPTESILGYELKERIGSGGYGEVWTAEAPGGLHKAIKFIFGFHDGDRAQREMKSLSHIKTVRHPFLLSLDRIDIVDGQMIIISELAEMSLKDRFDACRKEGMRGIPREELLRYMQETAEALDYINSQHSLQHLDVKPENLLLASGHIKVADFGLVKQIHDATASLLGGLTPLYAPPELFDGRPTRTSDQYSLAIVYQEMLTGSRPYDGETAAQLAAQHLRGRPRLAKLPRSDRSAIATALSKDPHARHADCRALIRLLSTSPVAEPPNYAGNEKPVSSDTEQVPLRHKHPGTLSTDTYRVSPLRKRSVQTTTLPVLQHDLSTSIFRPTLIIGLGSIGTRVLQGVRTRLSTHVGSREELPAISLLAIDADSQQLRQSVHSENPYAKLTSQEILATPLRNCDEYRERNGNHLSWLSRRWLYNIPRTLLTEGIRPLGRLAFADHCDQIRERITQSIQCLTDRNLTRTTAEKLALRPSDIGPRVMIVASISGGFGSGCVLDMAYLVRHILHTQGVPDDALLGILTYSAQHGSTQERDLMLANTYACLSEYHHYARAGFIGDESCNLPEVERGQSAFAQTYLLDLNRVNTLREQDHLQNISDYIYLSSATAAASLLDRCRTHKKPLPESQDPDSTDDTDEFVGATVSSFELTSIGNASGRNMWSFANQLVDHLLDRWMHHDHEPTVDTAPPAKWSAVTNALPASTDAAVAVAHQFTATLFDIATDVETWVVEQSERAAGSLNPRCTGPEWEAVCDALDQLTQNNLSTNDETKKTLPSPRQRIYAEWISTFANRITQPLQQTATAMMDLPDARLYSAKQVVAYCLTELNRLAADLRCRQEESRTKAREARAELLRPRAENSKVVEPIACHLLQVYLRCRYLAAVLDTSRSAMAAAIQKTTEISHQLKEVMEHVNQVRLRRQEIVSIDDYLSPSSLDNLLPETFARQREELIDQLGQAWSGRNPESERLSE
ncbi:MAG: protein kinase, partial [Planctomycetota bacterium]|nr:protein kinase [Planctomycetota bacterium]